MTKKSRRKQERKGAAPVVEILRNSDFPGSLPGFINLAQRQFEKTVPSPLKRLGSKLVTYQVPVDFYRMTMPPEHVGSIASIELTYRTRELT